MQKPSESDQLACCSSIKLLALDVDGVLTDGGLIYTERGEELKKFNVKDGQGIKLLMNAGIEVAIITAGKSQAVWHRSQRLGIKYTYMGIEDKLAIMKELCEELQLSLEQVAYVGDDLKDLPVLKAVGCPITVADAIPENKAVAVYITHLAGGQGCIREVSTLLLQSQEKMSPG